MTSHHRHWLAASAASAALFAACATTAWCQNALTDGVLGTQDVTGVGKIGRLHDNIRRAQQRESIYQEISDLYADYTKWKTRVQNDTNVLFSIDVSVLQQWGFADGGSPALQLWAAPSLDWTAFKSKEWGTGSIQVAYNATTRYPTAQNAADIQSNLGLITPINDNSTRFMNFAQLTYTQATPDNRWLFTAGQYPLSNFDGNAYLGNQQQNFNNYLFAQDATQTYLDAGLGAYVQFNATSTFHLLQDSRVRTTCSARRSRGTISTGIVAPGSSMRSGRRVSLASVPLSIHSRTSTRRAFRRSLPRAGGLSMRYKT